MIEPPQGFPDRPLAPFAAARDERRLAGKSEFHGFASQNARSIFAPPAANGQNIMDIV